LKFFNDSILVEMSFWLLLSFNLLLEGIFELQGIKF